MNYQPNPYLKKLYCLLMIVCGLAGVELITRVAPVNTSTIAANPAKQEVKGFHAEVSVQIQRAPNSRIHLNAGRALLTEFVGRAADAMRSNQTEALTLTSEDYDDDGVKDIVAGYGSGDSGLLTLQRGNRDAIYPNRPESQQHKAAGEFTDAPFFAEAQVFELPQRPDFMGAGDFDADGHQDVVVVAAGSNRLTFLSGDGQGNFSSINTVDLPGAVTALEYADVNRRDGLIDLIVGIMNDEGAKALVFESPEGAMRAEAEIIDLPAQAISFAITNLDRDYPIDIAVAAGNELLIVRGRDRKLSLDQAAQTKVEPVRISRHGFGHKIRSVIDGEFSSAKGRELALLTSDGSVFIIEPTAAGKSTSKDIKRIARGDFPTASRLIRARLSNELTDNLLLLDAAKQRVHLISTDFLSPHKGRTQIASRIDPATVSRMIVDTEPVVALPLRLNADSLTDVVMLRRGQNALTIIPSSPQVILQVLNAEDSGSGSLREAITVANEVIGPDQITFNIIGPSRTITLLSPLPAIMDTVTIDATTQPGFTGLPIVELNYSAAGVAQAGLVINAPSCAVRGLIINRVQGLSPNGNGIQINNSGTTIEGNFIGTNAAGSTALPNLGFGIDINNAGMVTIGGGTTGARNVISGNQAGGIELSGPQTSSVSVLGNFIGTNASGTASISTSDGVTIIGSAMNNTIGGAANGQGNLISGNQSGIFIAANGNLVQGNFIGVDVTGNADLGNKEAGIFISDSQGSTVGGVVAGARNIISGNDNRGIFSNGANNSLIQGNSIGVNLNGLAVPNNGGIALIDSSDNVVGGAAAGAGNIIAFNGDTGIGVLLGTGNGFLANSIFSNASLGINLNDDGVTPNDPGDADTGANNLQNFPVLTSARQTQGGTRVDGTLPGMPLTQYRIEFFANVNCDASGNGEGETFLGSTMLTTPAVTGAGGFTVLLPLVPPGHVITATATDPANNTSEFSQCISVLAGPGTADLSVTKTATPNRVLAGSLLTYRVTVINLGPDPATNVLLSEETPVNTTFHSLAAPAGWSCNTPPVNGVGAIICTTPALAAGEAQVFTLVVRVNAFASNGIEIRNKVTVSSSTPDLNPGNNVASVIISVITNCAFTCPSGITKNSDPNQCGTTVTYATPVAGGSCGAVSCTPASGSFFQRGVSIVNCSTNSGSSCSFTITVTDSQPPTVTCPANVIAVDNPPGSGTAVVNYTLPTTNDNCQGVTTVCTPPTGSVFPVGITTVACVISDAGGNSASCTFNVTVQSGPAQLVVTIAGSNTNLVFGGNSPVPARRRPAKDRNNPCSIFTVENKGFRPGEITLESIVRTGADVDGPGIGNANEGGLYSIRRVNPSGGEVEIPLGASVVIGIGETVSFCVKFHPLLPIVTTSTTDLPATLVRPNLITSRVNFRVAGGNPFSVNIVANLADDLVLIDPINTRRAPVVTFERIGDEYVLTYSLFDANLDTQRMKVELLDSGGRTVSDFDIDLVVPIRERNLVRGQSFTVVQRFSGANDNPQITAVRVTVTDSRATVIGTANLSNSRATNLSLIESLRAPVVILPTEEIRR
jgi:uncharacterized repeat protein (TIGR01451 family)